LTLVTVGLGKVPDKSPPALAVVAVVTKAVVASWVVFVPLVAVGAVGVPVNAGLADRATVVPVPVVAAPTIWVAPLVARTGVEAVSAAPLNCATVGDGYDPLKSPPAVPFGGSAVGSAAATNAVVASCVVFVPTVAVGAAGVPVSVGEAARTAVDPEPVVVAALTWPLTSLARIGAAAPPLIVCPLTFATAGDG
jgi:hypothetical protein